MTCAAVSAYGAGQKPRFLVPPGSTREKGNEMTTDEAVGTAVPLPFDTSKAHQARMYDYLLGGYFLNPHTSRL